MKSYFAYIRVSTEKQGERGSSLQEQRDAIKAFAAKNGMAIIGWFEERVTAAKIGRQEFSRMLSLLKRKKASGVIFHKIDRSTRNLKDWSTIQELTDLGIDVRFAHESVNLASNEGKLTGDFLAVISTHYIRNLREEVHKGIRGRLKQGLLPGPAPVGYLDQGPAKAKIPDPSKAPLIRRAFERYATRRYSLHAVSHELAGLGLRGRSGNILGPNHFGRILRNPFYVGVIYRRKSKESYLGIHEPIISKEVFDTVQKVLTGKSALRFNKHDFQFRQMIKCRQCGRSLTGERQKGHVYYRCHTRDCPTPPFREDVIETAIENQLAPVNLSADEITELRELAASETLRWAKSEKEYARAITLQLEHLESRISRLTDAFLDGALERPLFEEKKLALLMERRGLDEKRRDIGERSGELGQHLAQLFEPINKLRLSHGIENWEKRRILLESVSSNFFADEKNIVVELRSPFQDLAKLSSVSSGPPHRGRVRTFLTRYIETFVSSATSYESSPHDIPKVPHVPPSDNVSPDDLPRAA